MAGVEFRGVKKKFEGGAVALSQVDLRIRSGEFIVLVGPSGCGKSTLLRCLAGLEQPSAGQVLIEERDITSASPSERGIGMVFQDYALYPHMNARENLAFGLKMRGTPRSEITARVDEVSRMLGLEALLDRKPSQLSGGQRQRVAIGRALVRRPEVLLLDEPLSNLDAQLRARTRLEIAALHRRVGGTTLYVTHDQEEAMTLADRIVVLKDGAIQQVGPPMTLYREPANRFVAAFMGTPSMNFLEGELRQSGSRWDFDFEGLSLDVTEADRPESAGRYALGFRPESARIVAREEGGLPASVIWVESHGYETHVVASMGVGSITIRDSESALQVGASVGIRLNRNELHWFGEDGQRKN